MPVVKYDRNGFRPRLRQLVLTQTAIYLVEEAKIKQKIHYNSLKGEMGAMEIKRSSVCVCVCVGGGG